MSVHVFDLDHTLLSANSSYRFGAYLYQKGFFSSSLLLKCLRDYACHCYLGMSMQTLHDKIFTYLFKGCLLEEIRCLVHLFLNQSLSSLIYKPAMERLEEAQRRKEKVFILSSSPDFLVQAIAHHLGVSDWKGTTYQVDSEGYFFAVSSVLTGEKKREDIENWADQENFSLCDIIAYSDSYLDLPLLNQVGKAVGVRPDRRLRNICLKKGWEILGEAP